MPGHPVCFHLGGDVDAGLFPPWHHVDLDLSSGFHPFDGSTDAGRGELMCCFRSVWIESAMSKAAAWHGLIWDASQVYSCAS